MAQPEHNGLNRHGIGRNGVNAIDVLILRVLLQRSGGISRGRGHQGDDDFAGIDGDQSARRQSGHHAVLVLEILRTIENHFLVGLFAGQLARVFGIGVGARVAGKQRIERVADADAARAVADGHAPVGAKLVHLRAGEIARGKRLRGIIRQRSRRRRGNGRFLRADIEDHDADEKAQQHGANASADAKRGQSALSAFHKLFFSASLSHDLPPLPKRAR